MNAQELRIGNHTSFGKVYQIEKDCFYVMDDEGTSYKNKWAEINPIHITPELLEKCGFKKQTKEGLICENYDVYTLGELTYNSSHPGWWYQNTNWGMKENLKYLHQLQNLIFSLTGTELEITL